MDAEGGNWTGHGTQPEDVTVGRELLFRGRSDETLDIFVHLSPCVVEGPAVIDDEIGGAFLAFERPLAGFAAGQFFVGPASFADTLQANLPRNVDEDDGVAILLPAGLLEDRGVDEDGLDVSGR